MLFYYDKLTPETLSGELLDQLLAMGWYRTQQSVFTSSHVELGKAYRVHWLRYAVSEITERPSHRRLRNRNKNFHVTIEDFTVIKPVLASLHAVYRASINFDGALSIHDCLFGDEDAGRNIYKTKCISIYDQDKLIAGGYFDVGITAAASILHFFDPQYARYSLGRYLIMVTIDYLNAQHFRYYYPGYVVEGLSKMNYKLFLGREVAQYFDPEAISWKYFDESILVDPRLDGERKS